MKQVNGRLSEFDISKVDIPKPRSMIVPVTLRLQRADRWNASVSDSEGLTSEQRVSAKEKLNHSYRVTQYQTSKLPI